MGSEQSNHTKVCNGEYLDECVPVNGVAALLVATIFRSPALLVTSHAHPDPNCPAAALLNSALKLSIDPQALLMAAASSVLGAFLADAGERQCQKKVWFQTCEIHSQ